jgi:hypothetical protein
VLEKKFVCDITKCKGICCIEGDSGAPLEDNEIDILIEAYPKVKPYLREISLKTIEEKGIYEIDFEGDKVTTLVDNKECVFIIFDNDIAICAIEKAYFDKKIKFRKPISCHLYPIRVAKYKEFDAVNYDKNEICKSALENGKNLNVRLYDFLAEPLTRAYGKAWYKDLKMAANDYLKSKMKNG